MKPMTRLLSTYLLLLPGLTQLHAQEPPTNALAFENGAVLLEYSSEYGDRSSTQWLALGLIDGTPEMGWASKKGAPLPHTFLFELTRPYQLHTLAFDTRRTEESGYPGISARQVTVSVSNDQRSGPFEVIHRGEIEPQAITEVTLSKSIPARWVKLSIDANGGHPSYTELMEFMAYGKATGTERSPLAINATYHTNWNQFFMIVDENGLRGCYDYDNGVFDGAIEGHFINIEWREDGPQIGKAVMAITEDGSTFNGFWYEQGRFGGTWFGKRAEEGEKPVCAKRLGSSKGRIETSLDATGRAVMYGIYFDYDAATLKQESSNTLQEVKAWLQANPGKSIRFEGHTDADGSADYNLGLSARRADAVKQWMITQGIEAQRIETVGLGEARPVAGNDTAQGKALNRRVEIHVTGQ